MTDPVISAALRKPRLELAIVLTPPEGIEDWNNVPNGLIGVQPVAAIDRGGCFRYCSPQVLVSGVILAFLPIMAEGATPAETAAACEYLRKALQSDEDRINYDVSADRVVAERHPETGKIVSFTANHPVLISVWRPYGSRPSWPGVYLWARGPRVYSRLRRLAAAQREDGIGDPNAGSDNAE